MASVKVIGKDLDGNEVTCFVKRPTPKETTEAKISANIFASRLLNTKDVNGRPSVILRSQVDDHLKSLGIWSDKDEENIKEINKDISRKERVLASGAANGMTKEKAKQICIDIISLRDKQIEILSKKRELDRLTLESQIEQANFDTLLSLCLQDESGNRLFNSLEEYQENVEQPYAYQAAVELSKIVFRNNGDDDYRKDLPEYKWLVKYKYMNDKYQWVDSKGRLIDRESGLLVNSDGRYVNEDNEFIDSSGLRVDENGLPVVEFIEFDE
jgi:hypothetical protein